MELFIFSTISHMLLNYYSQQAAALQMLLTSRYI